MLISIAILVLIGLVAGTLAGLFGIGGGLIIVPALTALLIHRGFAADLAVPVAVATSLATMLLTAASAVWFHYRRGAVDLATLLRLGLGVAIGAIAGAALATFISGQALARVFAVIAALIGLRMMLGKTPRPRHQQAHPRGWWLIGPVIGAASALVGIGGGTFNVPYLVYNGYSMVRAVANASACGWPIALAGTATFALVAPAGAPPSASLGHVWLTGALLVGLGGMLAAPAGVALAHRLPAARLRRLFGVVLVLVALRMAW